MTSWFFSSPVESNLSLQNVDDTSLFQIGETGFFMPGVSEIMALYFLVDFLSASS